MGKNIIAQARGKGGPRYRAPSFRYAGEISYAHRHENSLNGKVVDLIHSSGHSSPLMEVAYENGETVLQVAPEGIRVGEALAAGVSVELKIGNVLPLRSIPEGASVYNIEGIPGDGGKFVRASGTFAKVKSHMQEGVQVILPSKKQKTFHPECRATIGVTSGGGRTEKPFVKAGRFFYAKRAKNKIYPVTSASKMNAVDHPFGNKRSLRKSKARPASRNAPPGRKVGMIAARRSGRKKK
ncbi:50S ribosomal protein L2 [Candidatus Woesearchaeota archaeon]|nr:50S ribosomal protein L2 [Candidatus Woesearchaeota archaeon]